MNLLDNDIMDAVAGAVELQVDAAMSVPINALERQRRRDARGGSNMRMRWEDLPFTMYGGHQILAEDLAVAARIVTDQSRNSANVRYNGYSAPARDYERILNRRLSGESVKDIAADYGVSHSTIGSKLRKIWRIAADLGRH